MTAMHSEKVGRCFRKASTKGMRFLNFSQDFGPGFYAERVEITSAESTIFMCASVVTPQSRDRSAETEVYPVALYQRPFSGSCRTQLLPRSRQAAAPPARVNDPETHPLRVY